MQLPFLKAKQWPRKLKLTGEAHYGYSEDDELKDSALKELCESVESKDSKKITQALKALIQMILSKEGDGASDSLEDS